MTPRDQHLSGAAELPFDDLPHPAEAAPQRDADEDFERERQGPRKGLPSNTQSNLDLALRKLDIRLRYNVFADEELIEGLHGYGPVIDDPAMNRLRLLIDERYHFLPAKEFFYDVVGERCRRQSFHPVCDYLDSLEWDGTERLSSWLVEYFGAEDTPLNRAIGRMFLVAAVRRVREPGCKFDEMLILESAQGTEKSTAIEALAVRPEWFSDEFALNAPTKELMEQTAGKWIIEAGELKGMSKGDVQTLKQCLSRKVDRARLSYGRKRTERPRQFVLFATTNEGEDTGYLKDPTGNRRFLPVRVRGADVEKLTIDRDQLWAEAAAAEAARESIRLPRELWEVAAVEQEARRVDDPFTDLLHRAIGALNGKIRALDCWRIVGIEPGDANQDQNMRLGAAMKELGWERSKRRFGAQRTENCYVRGSAEERSVSLGVDGKAPHCSATPDGHRPVLRSIPYDGVPHPADAPEAR